MKRIITVFVVISLTMLSITACNGKKTEQQLLDETLEILDNSMNDFIDGTVSNNIEENDEVATNEPNLSIKTVDLNILLEVKEETFDAYSGNAYRHVTANGILKERRLTDSWAWVEIDNDVRSLYSWEKSQTVFYTKNDNSLWGYGSNEKGILGDGTGVDKKEPVKILDDVATITTNYNLVFAIKTDKTFWAWGDGMFTPVMITDDVVECLSFASAVLKSDGLLYRFNSYDEDFRTGSSQGLLLTMTEISRSIEFKEVYTLSQIINCVKGGNNEFFWVDIDGALWLNTIDNPASMNWQPITNKIYDSDVVKVFSNGQFIKSDNSLWGYGNNSNGELGDGTKVPRDVPVKIADNVTNIYRFAYLTSNGELWKWDSNNPTPQKFLDNVAEWYDYALGGRVVLLKNGQIISKESYNDGEIIVENVKIPQMIVFP